MMISFLIKLLAFLYIKTIFSFNLNMKQKNKIYKGLDVIDGLIRRGELVEAFDLIQSKLKEYPDFITLKHRAVLCLANAGALEVANEAFEKLELHKEKNDEDILCLKGKILKAQALEADGERRAIIAQSSVKQYESAYILKQDHYPGINLATLYLLAGDHRSSKNIANKVLESLCDEASCEGELAYYYYASKAEAYLLLGNQEEAKKSLTLAVSMDPANYRARASTLKQFELILVLQKKKASWLNSFRLPISIHYGGYIFSEKSCGRLLSDTDINNLEGQVFEKLSGMNVGFGYGSLAAGSDIVIAEAILTLAAELHVVLPCNKEQFFEQSVVPYGNDWVERFNVCINRASSVQIASQNLNTLDATLLQFSSQVAMGRAILRSNTLATTASQFLIWDGPEKDKNSISHCDHQFWRKTGLQQTRLSLLNNETESPKQSGHKEPKVNSPDRMIIAMLFADFNKFGGLNEEQVGAFVQGILNPLAQTLQLSGLSPFEVNTWGDGIFIAFEGVNDAAKCAIEFQKCFSKIDLAALGLPSDLSLRIGANYGPVFYGIDSFLDRPTVFGPNVTFAARIEPITVPGSTYVSESFASVLSTQLDSPYKCDYIGRVKLHKSGEKMPIYSLRALVSNY